MSSVVDVAKLTTDAERWPRDWEPVIDEHGEWCGSFSATNEESEDPHEIETGPDTNYSVNLGKFLADAVNALPVLLEVAQAGKAWRDAFEASRVLSVSALEDPKVFAELLLLGEEGESHPLDRAFHERERELLAVLAKVSL